MKEEKLSNEKLEAITLIYRAKFHRGPFLSHARLDAGTVELCDVSPQRCMPLLIFPEHIVTGVPRKILPDFSNLRQTFVLSVNFSLGRIYEVVEDGLNGSKTL